MKPSEVEPGMRFGTLTVLEVAKGCKENKYKPIATTVCDCGKEKIASCSSLARQSTRSCGSYECRPKTQRQLDARQIHPGAKFGKLTVLRNAGKILRSKPGYKGRATYRRQWDCLCECGKTTTVDDANLRSGGTVSCGCAHTEGARNRDNSSSNLIGERFGRLVVLDVRYGKRQNGKSTTELLCRCDCGTEKWISAISVKYGNTSSCGCLKKDVIYETKTAKAGYIALYSDGEEYIKLSKHEADLIGRSVLSRDSKGGGFAKLSHYKAWKKEGRSLRSDEWLRRGVWLENKITRVILKCDNCGEPVTRVPSTTSAYRGTSRTLCKKCHYGKGNPKYTESELCQIAAMKVSGASTAEVCVEFNCSKHIVYKAMKKWQQQHAEQA